MPLSWNEIRSRAIEFSNEFASAEREHAEAKSFWDAFFNVFGISRRRVATFEKPVKKLNNKQGFVDLFWKGVILVEHKSKGKNLDKAYHQATDYFAGLKEYELPKYILVSDFERFRLFNLDTDEQHEFTLNDFSNHIHLFGFIAGYEQKKYKDEDPVNIEAAELMGGLHDKLKTVGYDGHALEVYLVRLLFCLFAEDTGIFERQLFQDYIELHTKDDGSDLAQHIAIIFQTLNTPKNKRLSNIDENLDAFPYVNGQLFAEMLPFASFDTKMRDQLLKACALDWSKISPAIFGSMFQAAMDTNERRNLGAHYTSEKNIQKLIRPLFLDELYAEFEKAKSSSRKLQAFQNKLATLKFFDPACGSGNFLIITYREIRDLEIKVLQELYKTGQGFLNVGDIIQVNVDQFYGIEIDEFAAKIAEVGMWLIDHQMNIKVSNIFGQYFTRLPLKASATIVHGNSLHIDWNDVVDKDELNYIIGNPPFIGKQYQTKNQKSDLATVFDNAKKVGNLDYVTGWFIKSAKYIQKTNIETAFVSTNSISQGEQVSILWSQLFKYDVIINFAHRTFRWTNEAKGKAAVHVVIVSFSCKERKNKILFEYEDIKGEPLKLKVNRINPYLVSGKSILINSRKKPICNVPEMQNGSMPNDSGFLILSPDEKEQFLIKFPNATKFVKRLVGAREFIRNQKRYCLWLLEATHKEIRSNSEILERINNVKSFRLKSTRAATRKLASFPSRFGEVRQPSTNYIITPVTSSENREYIPMSIYSKDIIATNLCNIIPVEDYYLLGLIMSKMSMTWVKYICGRLKSDYRFTKDNVYNNYPFPKEPSDKNRKKVETAAQKVLDTRAKFPNSSLADLYDPLTMPKELDKAHQALDKAVDLCYRPQAFTNERARIEFLFDLYEQYTAPLMAVERKKKRKK